MNEPRKQPTTAEIQVQYNTWDKGMYHPIQYDHGRYGSATSHIKLLLARLAAVGHLPDMWREDNSHNTDHADQLQEILETTP